MAEVDHIVTTVHNVVGLVVTVVDLVVEHLFTHLIPVV